jgi:hypothetical protein
VIWLQQLPNRGGLTVCFDLQQPQTAGLQQLAGVMVLEHQVQLGNPSCKVVMLLP